MQTKKVKICFIVAVDITLKLILLNYLKHLKEQGYEIWAVCSPSPFLEELRKEGIQIKAIAISRKIHPLKDFISYQKLVSFLRQEKFDIVQVQTPKAAFIGQLAARAAHVPIIINNNFGFYFENFSPLKKQIFIFFERFAARSADLMFTINKEDIENAKREKIIAPEKLRYLGFGIDTDRFDPQHFSEAFIEEKKREIGIAPNKKVVGIIARLVKEKGYLELFAAWKMVMERFPEAVLIIIGIEEPEKKDRIRILKIKEYGIEKSVIFLGEKKNTEAWYSIMDIFVLPTHREGLGNTILEASSMQKPVIASNIRGCRESVDHGKTGILVPVKNPEALAQAIITLLLDADLRRKFGVAGRERILREFTQKVSFDRMMLEYNRLIKEKL